MKSAGKARNNGLYRHIRTSKEIIRNLLNDYAELLKRKKTASFTLTPKLWIDQTKAIGIVSKQGKNGGTFAHPMIACEFASWIAPEFKMQLLKLSLDRTKLR